MKAKINRANILEHLVERQFNLIEKTMLDTVFNKNFREEWTLTKEQHETLKNYAIPLMKKVFKFNKQKAIDNFRWFMWTYGLKVK